MNQLNSSKNKKIVKEFPQLNSWDKEEGVRRIFDIIHPILFETKDVIFCFNNCFFLSAEAIAILVGIKLHREKNGLDTSLDIDSIKTRIKEVLIKSRCLEFFGRKPPRWNDNSFPIFVKESLEKEDIANYIEDEIFGRDAIPKMTKGLKKEIEKAIFEIFGNVFYHSESEIGGLVCGQVYPRKKEIQIVFYDTGIGIATCVRRKKKQ